MASATAATAAAVPRQQPQEEADAVFAAKHAELLCEARAMAREHGVTVRTVAFRPDGSAVAHELVGAGREERLRGMVARAAARDVSAMGCPRQVAAHHRQLLVLRDVVLRELLARKTTTAAEEVGVVEKEEEEEDDVEAAAGKKKRAAVKQEVDGDGDGSAAKSRRTEY